MKIDTGLIIVLLLSFLFKIGNAQNSTPDKRFNGVTQITIHSDLLNEDRRLFVYVPEDESGLKYPVIYLLDGEMSRAFGEVLEFAKTNPHIIVGIANNGNRNRDMTPVKIESRPGSGGAGKFLSFLTRELKPYINDHYLSSDENILIGASNAGLFTLYAMLSRPEEYMAYISLSPTVGYCNDYLEQQAIQLEPKSRLKDKHLYILYGLRHEMTEVTQYVPAFTDHLRKQFQYLQIYCEGLPNADHVPIEGIEGGLNFVYSKSSK